MVADEVQRQVRAVFEPFIGQKFLPGVLSQLEGRLAKLFKSLVSAQIITAYTGIKASVDPNDPTAVNIRAAYSPVLPLLYIFVDLTLRSQV
jgi:hypothetical protein